jgi:DNA-binding LytR/AlgR family response regulator
MLGKNIRVLLVEKDNKVAGQIINILNNDGINKIQYVDNFASAEDSLSAFTYDIVLIDIFLRGDRTGTALGKYIRDNYKMPFIYLALKIDSDVFAIVKDTHPDAFVSKPVDSNNLICNLYIAIYNRTLKRIKTEVLKDRIFIKKDGVYKKFFLKDITFIISEHVYNFLYQKDGSKTILRGRLRDFHEKFSNYFIQINKRCVVNVFFIDHFDKNTVTVNNKVLEVGPKYKKAVYSRLVSF